MREYEKKRGVSKYLLTGLMIDLVLCFQFDFLFSFLFYSSLCVSPFFLTFCLSVFFSFFNKQSLGLKFTYQICRAA